MAVVDSKSGRKGDLGGRRHAGRAAALLVNPSGAAKARLVKIPIRSKIARMLAAAPDAVASVIEAYFEAVEKSRLSGRSVRFEVDVRPAGAPGITEFDIGSPVPAMNDDLAGALIAARARGRERVAEILSGDEMLTADAFAALIGISRMTVNVRRRNQQILGLEGARRGYRFPAWQVGEDGKPFTALPALFESLGGLPWTVYRFLVQPHAELGGLTGRDALRRGLVAQTIDAAESVARGDFA
jgi:hypothetical protein